MHFARRLGEVQHSGGNSREVGWRSLNVPVTFGILNRQQGEAFCITQKKYQTPAGMNAGLAHMSYQWCDKNGAGRWNMACCMMKADGGRQRGNQLQNLIRRKSGKEEHA